jgi:hypothetical protein
MNDRDQEMVDEVLTKVNEDYCGFYELVWSFRTRWMPEADESRIIDEARRATEAVLQDEYARLIWIRLLPEPAIREVSHADVATILARAESWSPPRSWSDWYSALDATESGRIAWRRMPKMDSG